MTSTANKNQASWDKRYSTEQYVFGVAPEPYLATQASLFPDKQVLSVGGGEGKNEVWVAQQGAHVLSVDISSVGLEKSQRLAKQNNVRIDTEVADLYHWEWPVGQYDIVAWFFVHFAPEENRKIIEGMSAALKPGGYLIGSLFVDHTAADSQGEKVVSRYDSTVLEQFLPPGDLQVGAGTKQRGSLPPEPIINFLFKKD